MLDNAIYLGMEDHQCVYCSVSLGVEIRASN